MIKVLITAILLIACQISLIAQSLNIPELSQLNIGFGYMPVLRFAPKYFDYTPQNFLRATIGVNFGKGYIRYQFQYTRITPDKATSYPDCMLFDNAIAYHYYFPISKHFYLFGGGQIGLNTYHMDVQGTVLYAARTFETEISSGLEIGTEFRMNNKLGLMASFKRQWIFAAPRNDMSMLDVGLIYYFKSSTALKKWLD